MDVRQLSLFVAVAEAGSIRRAAQRVYVAQPHLSQVIRRLEREVGTPLLLRSPQGVELTAAGTVLLDQARVVIGELERTVELVRAAGAPPRTFVVGLLAGVMAAGELTTPILTAFQHGHPGLSIRTKELSFAEQLTALLDGEVDVALVRPPAPHGQVEIIPLLTEPRVLCVDRNHPLADASCVAADDILHEPMIDLAGSSRSWNEFWLLDDLRGGPGPRRSSSVTTVRELKSALMLEKAVMPVASSTWRMGLRDRELRVVALSGAAPSTIAVAHRRGETRSEVLEFSVCASATCRLWADLVEGGVLAAASN